MAERVNAYGQSVGAPLPGWQPRPLPDRTGAEGRWCRLEPLSAAAHGAALFAALGEAADGRDWTYLPGERPASRDAFARELAARERSCDPLHFTILVDGAACGTAALMRIDAANGVIEIGHVLFAPRLQRTRAATEAIALLMRRAFDDLGYRRLEWKCDSLNAPSRRAALRLGFTFEGVFRHAVVTKDRNRDTAWYSIVDAEWPSVGRALDLWLDPGNFDEEGRQHASLADLRAGSGPEVRDAGA